MRKLGYSCRLTLEKWILELAPDEKKYCCSNVSKVKYTREQKEQAVISLCSRCTSSKEAAAEHGTTREYFFFGKTSFLKRGEQILWAKEVYRLGI
jgi:putative transposase